jgi:hypothetical protein
MRNSARYAILSLVAMWWMTVLASLVSCSGEAPEIRQVFWQLNVTQDPSIDLEFEELSVFVNVADADGVEDVDLLYILQDRHELLWELTSGGWRRFENGEEVWVGSNSIQMADGLPFPRDLYRVILIDRSGERSRDEFYINSDEIDGKRASFPRSTVRDGTIIVEGEFTEVTFWFYDSEHSLVKIFTSGERELPLASALNTRELQTASYFHANTVDSAGGYGLIYGPVYLE